MRPPRPPRARGPRRPADGGMATAELAVALPVLALLVGALLFTLQLAGAHLACGAAAREAARALARGEPAGVLAERSAALPDGARLVVREGADSWQVTVRLPIRGPRLLVGLLPAAEVAGRAVAAKEPVGEAAP